MAAHLLGVSMGGGLAQDVAVTSPSRVRSLTLVATSCAFRRASSSPLPGPSPALFADPPADPDWSSSEAVVSYVVEAQRPYAGGLGLDEDTVRVIARQVVRRSRDLRASVVNHWQVVGGEGDGPEHTMAEISQPTLVVHGSDDPMFPVAPDLGPAGPEVVALVRPRSGG